MGVTRGRRRRLIIERVRGTAADLHARLEGPWPTTATAFVNDVIAPALVLGSAQPDTVVDRSIAVVRRRTGGGAVLLEPGHVAWIDVVVPRSDERWTDDVRDAPLWLGARWAQAIGDDAHVHHGAMVTNEWSALVCFAGLAAGEVTRGPDGPKLVGISQRRTRAGAWFQCVALGEWDGVRIARLLGREPDATLTGSAVGLGEHVRDVEQKVVSVLT